MSSEESKSVDNSPHLCCDCPRPVLAVNEDMITKFIQLYMELEPGDPIQGVDDPSTRSFAKDLLTAALTAVQETGK